jgi:hypothetical protein
MSNFVDLEVNGVSTCMCNNNMCIFWHDVGVCLNRYITLNGLDKLRDLYVVNDKAEIDYVFDTTFHRCVNMSCYKNKNGTCSIDKSILKCEADCIHRNNIMGCKLMIIQITGDGKCQCYQKI